jgi:1,4-alpha-glucan branching enzyme
MHWNPPAEEKHVWEHIDPVKPANPDESVRIYESHVGMAQEDGKVSSYREYAEHILPRVKKAGYNVI